MMVWPPNIHLRRNELVQLLGICLRFISRWSRLELRRGDRRQIKIRNNPALVWPLCVWRRRLRLDPAYDSRVAKSHQR